MKKKFNFNNIKSMKDKKMHNPQQRVITIDKKNANRTKTKNV